MESVLSVPPGFRKLTSAELVGEFPALTKCFDADGYFRTNPAFHPMDGFFAAVLVRKEP